MSRIDLLFDRQNPANEFAGIDFGANITDMSFGYFPDEEQSAVSFFFQVDSGPCTQGDQSFMGKFIQASVVSEFGNYECPNTLVSFVFKGVDDYQGVLQGAFYRDALISEGSPLVRTVTVPNVSHAGPGGIYASEVGSRQVQNSLFEACQVWE